jgi:hypothetical protein
VIPPPKNGIFCRCCARRVTLEGRSVPLWCRDCRQHIIDGDRLGPEERNYEAQYGIACPFRHDEPDPQQTLIASDGAT